MTQTKPPRYSREDVEFAIKHSANLGIRRDVEQKEPIRISGLIQQLLDDRAALLEALVEAESYLQAIMHYNAANRIREAINEVTGDE